MMTIEEFEDKINAFETFDLEPLSSIAIQVKRNLRYLKNSVIPDMVAEGFLIRKYPETPSHPDQQYKAGKK